MISKIFFKNLWILRKFFLVRNCVLISEKLFLKSLIETADPTNIGWPTKSTGYNFEKQREIEK